MKRLIFFLAMPPLAITLVPSASGQLHDVTDVSESEADSFYSDTTAMYLKYYSLNNTDLRDDLQAAIWERRDVIEGPSGTRSVDSFSFSSGQYQLGSSEVTSKIPQYTSFLNLPSGGIGTIFTPISTTAYANGGDLQYSVNGKYYNYNHSVQEFGYEVPEPSSLLLLGSGMILAAGLLRRRK